MFKICSYFILNLFIFTYCKTSWVRGEGTLWACGEIRGTGGMCIYSYYIAHVLHIRGTSFAPGGTHKAQLHSIVLIKHTRSARLYSECLSLHVPCHVRSHVPLISTTLLRPYVLTPLFHHAYMRCVLRIVVRLSSCMVSRMGNVWETCRCVRVYISICMYLYSFLFMCMLRVCTYFHIFIHIFSYLL